MDVEFPYRDVPMTWRSTAMSRASKQEGWTLDASNDVRGAASAFERALESDPDDPQSRQMLVGLYRKLGRYGDATTHLDWLMRSWTQTADFWSGRNLVVSLEACGRAREAIDVAVSFLSRFPNDGMIWRYRAQCEFFDGRHDDALRSIEEAIRLAPDRWSHYWRFKIHFVGKRDVAEGIRSIYRAYVRFNDADAAIADLRALVTSSDASQLRPVLESFVCEADVRARLGQLLDEVVASLDGEAAARVLSAHLRRSVSAIRSAGAKPVFLSYPVPQSARDVLRAIAGELDVKFIDVQELFPVRMGTRRWNDVRAPDGHCNDEGYRLMAELVAEGLQDLVSPTVRCVSRGHAPTRLRCRRALRPAASRPDEAQEYTQIERALRRCRLLHQVFATRDRCPIRSRSTESR